MNTPKTDENPQPPLADTPGSGCPACEIYRSEFFGQLDRADALQKTLESERAALARFLVPWRFHLPDCWLEHMEKECGVYFDEIGFVRPRPVTPNAKVSDPAGRTETKL